MNSSYISRLTQLFLTERSRSWWTAAALAAMMLLVVALSHFFFLNQSLRLDEAQSLWQSSRSPIAIFTVVAEDVHVPLYHELLHFWRLFIGDGVSSARIMSLVFYLASIPAMYFLGKKAYSRSVGLLGALLLTISPFMNWYGNEIRMYTLFTFMVILNQYFFIQIWKDKQKDTWFWYAVTAVLGVFAHYFFFLNLLAQTIFYFTHQKLFPKGSFVRFVVSAVVVVGTFIPWITYVLLLGEAGNQSPHLAVPSTVDLFSTFQQLLLGFQNDNINTFILSLWPLALIFGFLALRRKQRMLPETQYFILAVFVPIIIAFFGSFVIAPVFISRYLILTVPALYLCLLSLFGTFTPRVALIARSALIVLMLVMMGVEIVSPTTPVKEDYRQASDYLTANTTSQDVVIISAPFTVYPIEYYYHGAAPVSTLPIWNQYSFGAIPAFSAATLPSQVASSTVDAQEVWLLLSYDQGYQSTIQTYFQSHYQLLSQKTFSPDMTLYVYKLRYDTPLSKAAVAFK